MGAAQKPAIGVDADVIVLGAGFYGCEVALALKRLGMARVVLLEREPGILRRASYVNQARVHNGYHYPRSLPTAESSRLNYQRFLNDHAAAIMPGGRMVYAVARGSRVSASQFEHFCASIGAPCAQAPVACEGLFDSALIEAVFEVRECAFDATRLANELRQRLAAHDIEVMLNTPARVVAADDSAVTVATPERRYRTSHLVNCTYGALDCAGIKLRTPVKKELAEIALIAPPPALAELGVTVIDGPFFSTMPFPAAGLHSLSHVLYTPHETWLDARDKQPVPRRSNARLMLRDAARYLPLLSGVTAARSIFDIKAVLMRNEEDDGRPILFEQADMSPRIVSILGAKFDNIYDVASALEARSWTV